MSITREQIADLQPGDVVELSRPDVPGVRASAPAVEVSPGRLYVGIFLVRWENGDVPANVRGFDLTVISRAPGPLYVNHPRTEPAAGDVVRDGKGDIRHVAAESADFPKLVWWGNGTKHYGSAARWTYCSTESIREMGPATLLVDGETGQVVPS